MRPVLDLVSAAQNRRRAAASQAADLSETQAAVRSAFEVLAAVGQDRSGRFQVEALWKTLHETHQALLLNPLAATPDATFQRHSEFIVQALDLVRSVADHSQVRLDPDLVTAQMVQVSVIRGPAQTENAARLPGMGTHSTARARCSWPAQRSRPPPRTCRAGPNCRRPTASARSSA